MKKVYQVFRIATFVLVVITLLVCTVQSYRANHYYDTVIAGALLCIYSDVELLLFRDNAEVPKNGQKLVFGLTEAIAKRLTVISKMVGAGDFTDVVREALIVYDTLVTAIIKDGVKVFIEAPDGKRAEFVIPTSKTKIKSGSK